MEKQTEKIMKFSKVIFILLNIAFIALIIISAFQVLAFLWTRIDLPTEIVSIGGRDMEVPVLFKIGNTNIALPITWESGFGLFVTRTPFFELEIGNLFGNILLIIGLGFVMSVFKKLREGGSPFREDIVKSLKKTSIALLCMGIVSGGTALAAAGIVWVLCLIFDYGRALQNESDTTL